LPRLGSTDAPSLETRGTERLAVRIGIATAAGFQLATGPARVARGCRGWRSDCEGSAEEQAVVGETPTLAAGLQALAEPGKLVLAGVTRRLIAGSAKCMPVWRRASSPHRTAWALTGTATSMSANSPAAPGRTGPVPGAGCGCAGAFRCFPLQFRCCFPCNSAAVPLPGRVAEFARFERQNNPLGGGDLPESSRNFAISSVFHLQQRNWARQPGGVNGG
jgi:hypothetical protein